MDSLAIPFITSNPLSDAISWLADQLRQAYGELVLLVMRLLRNSSLPSNKLIQSDWYSLQLGGTYGLAIRLFELSTVLIGLLVVISPLRNHGRKIGRLTTTIPIMVTFGYLFYPAYSMFLNFSHSMSDAIISYMQTTTHQKFVLSGKWAWLQVPTPGNDWAAIGTSMMGGGFGAIILLESAALLIFTLGIILFYPITIALRPLSQKTDQLFHLFNSGLMTVFLSPPIMILFYGLPLLGSRFLPQAGVTSVAIIVLLTLIGGVGALVTPPLLAWWLIRQSQEMFGTVEAGVSGTVDINSMPTVTTEEMTRDVDANHSSGLGAFVKGAALVAVAGELGMTDDILHEIRRMAPKGREGHFSAGVAASRFVTGGPKQEKGGETK